MVAPQDAGGASMGFLLWARQCAIAGFVGVMLQGCAGSHKPLSKAELYALSPGVGADRILGQMSDLLILPDAYRGARPKHVLEQYDYQLKPHASDVPGLCASETIVFHFEPLDRRASGDTPTRLASVELLYPRFRLREIPSLPYEPLQSEGQNALNAHCRAEGYNSEKYIPAQSATQIVEALWLLQAIKAQVPANASILAEACKGEDAKGCIEDFNELSAGTLLGVADCSAEQTVSGWQCLQLSRRYSFAVAYSGHEGAIKVGHLKVWETVIVGDYREE